MLKKLIAYFWPNAAPNSARVGSLENQLRATSVVHPESTQARFIRILVEAKDVYHNGRYADAAAILDKLTDDPLVSPAIRAEALFVRARSLEKLGDTDGMLRDYQLIIDIPGVHCPIVASMKTSAINNRALHYEDIGETGLARADFDGSTGFNNASSQTRATAYRARAGFLHKNQEFEAAVQNLSIAIDLPNVSDDEMGLLRIERARSLEELDQQERATVDYLVVLNELKCTGDTMGLALLNFGHLRLEQEQYEEAIQLLTRAIENPGTSPNDLAKSFGNRGFSHLKLENWDACISDSTAAMFSNDADEMIISRCLGNRRKARALRDGPRGLQDAIDEFTRELESGKISNQLRIQLLFERGNSFGHAREFEKAIAETQAVLDMAENNSETCCKATAMIGCHYWHLGDYAKSSDYYSRGLELATQNGFGRSWHLFNLCEVIISTGTFDEVVATFQRAFRERDDPKYCGEPEYPVKLIAELGAEHWDRYIRAIAPIYALGNASNELLKGVLLFTEKRLKLSEPFPLRDWVSCWDDSLAPTDECKEFRDELWSLFNSQKNVDGQEIGNGQSFLASQFRVDE